MCLVCAGGCGGGRSVCVGLGFVFGVSWGGATLFSLLYDSWAGRLPPCRVCVCWWRLGHGVLLACGLLLVLCVGARAVVSRLGWLACVRG